MTQSSRRIARYRDPQHSGRDPLDIMVTTGSWIAIVLVNLTVFLPVLLILAPFDFDLAATAVLVISVSNLVVMRGVSVFGQHVIRRWIFDHEQRHHEIVPLTDERRPTRA